MLATCGGVIGGGGDLPDGSGSLSCCEGSENCGCIGPQNPRIRVCTSCTDNYCTQVLEASFLDPTVVEQDEENSVESNGTMCLDVGPIDQEFVCEHTNTNNAGQAIANSTNEPVDIDTDEPKEQEPPMDPPEEDVRVAVVTPVSADPEWERVQLESEQYAQEGARQAAEQKSSGEPPGQQRGESGGRKTETSEEVADPVLIGSGALFMTPTDLSFPGPKMPLEFTRHYHSQSSDRGHLGSNWSHNWETRLEVLRPDTAPGWAARYCKVWYPFATCLRFIDPVGNTEIFAWDPGSNLYKPPSGAFESIRPILGGGWVMRDRDGTLRDFNKHGYLIRVVDRFGNGFRIEQQVTPLFAVFRRYCHRESDADPANGLIEESAEAPFDNLDPRICSFMAAAFDDQLPLDLSYEGWQGGLELPHDRVAERFPYEPEYRSNEEHRDMVTFGRRYLEELFKHGYFPAANQGSRRYRPLRVIDDLGRSLEFNYTSYDPDSTGGVSNPTSAGLLASVDGPAGSRLEFSYARPLKQPARSQESYLVEVLRTGFSSGDPRVDDSQWLAKEAAAEPRRYVYTYQWPEHVGALMDSWDDHEETVRAAYLEFFSATLGCAYYQALPCDRGTFSVNPGNACFQTEVVVANYISDVADNLIFVERSGRHEVQSTFVADPNRGDFDRVTAQQFGGIPLAASLTKRFLRLAADLTSFSSVDFEPTGYAGRFTTFLKTFGEFPAFHLDYVDAGPIGISGIDRTELELPEDLRTRYPLESGDFDFPEEVQCERPEDANDDTICVDDPDHDSEFVKKNLDEFKCDEKDFSYDLDKRPPCRPGEIDDLRRGLPGNGLKLEYQDPDVQPSPPMLYRSRFTCEQIAQAVLSDPFHNDNLSTMRPETGSDYKPELILGRRATVKANHGRICQWTETTDRDGRVVWTGVNFRGQPLAKAEQLSDSSWRFTDRFYNADGHLIEERWPQSGTSQSRAGYLAFDYEDLDPADEEWNAKVPAYWARRANLLGVSETPPSPVWDEQSQSYTESRAVRFTYEPLFNELQSVTRTVTPRFGSEEPLNRTLIEFDYQELSGLDPGGTWSGGDPESIGQVLIRQIPWGLAFAHDVNSNDQIVLSDADFVITDWQFAMRMYGRDLNGDGVRGFPDNGAGAGNKAKGVPVRIRQQDLATGDPERLTFVRWAPHGLPSAILEPNGRTTTFDYYRLPTEPLMGFQPFGTDVRPADSEVSNQFKGLLARVTWNRFDPNYLAGTADCSSISSPYRFLLRECAGGAEAQLSGLGLPDFVVDEIIAADTAIERVSFAYATTGHTHRVWDNASRETTIVRDSDGRPVKTIDPLMNTTTVEYTVDGWPLASETRDDTNNVLSQTRRAFDNEGRVLGVCQARSAGSCATAFASVPPIGSTSGLGQQLRLFRYSNEGLLVAESDPEGLVTYHDYDGVQRLTQSRTPDPDAPSSSTSERRVTFEYDLLDRLITRIWGTPETRQTTNSFYAEAFTFDGFHRLVTHNDRRNTVWQHGYSRRDERVATKQSDVPYEFGSDPNPYWEVATEYNGFSERVLVDEHGLMTTEFLRTLDGRVYAEEATGKGRTWFGYDTSGRVVYSIGPYLDERVTVWNPDNVGGPDGAPARATATLRRPREGDPSAHLWQPGAFSQIVPVPRTITEQGQAPLTTTRLEVLDANLVGPQHS